MRKMTTVPTTKILAVGPIDELSMHALITVTINTFIHNKYVYYNNASVSMVWFFLYDIEVCSSTCRK